MFWCYIFLSQITLREISQRDVNLQVNNDTVAQPESNTNFKHNSEKHQFSIYKQQAKPTRPNNVQ